MYINISLYPYATDYENPASGQYSGKFSVLNMVTKGEVPGLVWRRPWKTIKDISTQ
jgi:hypothetical protein